MQSLILRRGVVIATAVAAAMTLSGHVVAQTPPQTKLTGLIHDYTPSLDAFGPWQIVGDWTLTVNATNSKVDFLAALSMVRSENATRMHHTHHLQLTDGQVTPLADGYRISGTASFTVNGIVAAFTGSPVDIEITGTTGVPYANIAIAIGGAAAAHFGPQIKGVVVRNQP
jgi:hypothetical protein